MNKTLAIFTAAFLTAACSSSDPAPAPDAAASDAMSDAVSDTTAPKDAGCLAKGQGCDPAQPSLGTCCPGTTCSGISGVGGSCN
jgi:hypothetical protein